jgi:two-component system sensor histidine kinase DegS
VEALLSGNDSEEARSEMAMMESTIDKSLKELRRVLTGLRPPALDELGLNHALRQSLEELKVEGINCRFSEVGTSYRLPSTVEIAVYRAVQEALTNIRKHADATKVNVRMQFQSDKFQVEVRDDGRGFDLSQTLEGAVAVGHIGLLGMKQRADMLGGDVRIKTSEGSGTSITLSIPIQSQEEEK